MLLRHSELLDVTTTARHHRAVLSSAMKDGTGGARAYRWHRRDSGVCQGDADSSASRVRRMIRALLSRLLLSREAHAVLCHFCDYIGHVGHIRTASIIRAFIDLASTLMRVL